MLRKDDVAEAGGDVGLGGDGTSASREESSRDRLRPLIRAHVTSWVPSVAAFAATFVLSPHHTSDENRQERRRGVGDLCGVHCSPCLELEAASWRSSC